MSEPEGGRTYLGGIGAMLAVAHVCPRCGAKLSDSPSASSRHMEGNRCRPTVFAALPEPEVPVADEEEVPPVPAWRQIRDYEAPSSPRPSPPMLGSGAPVRALTGAGRSLSVPWLAPPDLGEVF